MTWKHELGIQIREARKAAAMTQDELAHELGVARQMIGRYESGHDAPSIEILGKAATVLGIEFQVRGFRITFEATRRALRPPPRPQQLRLEFDKPHTFPGATVQITPTKGKLIISAVVPA